ncbi:hypothetical protein CLAFUR4_12645 [Fulvia fulva]|nr:hypothetical protein CLAFUR4_12645 [Fulvia fulva]KAK4619055.1 hypothetical protein CLAFUR0_12656 [Fulvia fulva]
MLSIPEGYKGNLRTHSSEKDAIQDREKIMMLLHDKEGSPSPHLSTEQRELLTAEQVHYIDKLWLEKQYVGTGLGFHFTGPVVLSPAPMDVKDTEYDEGMKKLIESYKRSGFEVWVNPDFQLRGPIAVMASTATFITPSFTATIFSSFFTRTPFPLLSYVHCNPLHVNESSAFPPSGEVK